MCLQYLFYCRSLMNAAFPQLKISYRNWKIQVTTSLASTQHGPMECSEVVACEAIHNCRYVNITKLRDHVAVASTASEKEKLVTGFLKT